MPSLRAIIDDPAAHNWLRVAAAAALSGDPVDAAGHAEVLVAACRERAAASNGHSAYEGLAPSICHCVRHGSDLVLCGLHAAFWELVMEHRRDQFDRWGLDQHVPDEWVAILAERLGRIAGAANVFREQMAGPGATIESERIGAMADYQNRVLQLAALTSAVIDNLQRDFDHAEVITAGQRTTPEELRLEYMAAQR